MMLFTSTFFFIYDATSSAYTCAGGIHSVVDFVNATRF